MESSAVAFVVGVLVGLLLGFLLGILDLRRLFRGRRFDEHEGRTPLTPVGLATHLYLDRLGRRFTSDLEEVAERATRDPLTSVRNRQGVLVELFNGVEKANIEDRAVAVAMIDFDHFKAINDTMGHAGGDLVLSHVAGVMNAYLPDGWTLGRYGGDEFCLVMPGTDADGAYPFLEALRARVAAERISVEGNEASMTLSIGVASGEVGRATADALVRNADVAAYEAKENGRNRVEVFSPARD